MNGHVRPQVVLMEGPLKKRGATMPVMRDRYCVATYEAPQSPTERHGHGVVLKTYKTHDDYIKHPQKPNEVYTLKCVGEWDGKGNFHKYPFPFLLETTESKVVLCAAPTLQDKRQWMALMDQVVDAPVRHSTDDEQLHKRVTDPNVLFAAEDDDEDFGKAAAAAVQHARSLEKQEISDAADELNSEDSDDGAQDSNSDVDRVVPVSPLPLSPPNDKLLFRAESTESLTAANDEHAEASEPADWGMYGDNDDANGPSRYDVVDGPTLSLETDLLATKAAAPLASDAFLFEQNGPTFGAVVVPTSSTGDSNSDDFVDPVLQERLMREEHEKQRERVTKKLESNRDLYAEMAAARLKSMRKDAKTKPRRQEQDDDGHGDDWSDHEDDADRSRADTATSSMHDAPMAAFELEEIESGDEMQVKRQSSSKKKKSKAPAAEEFLFGEASVPPVSQVEASGASADADAEEAEERRIRREKRRLKRQQEESEAAKLEEVERARARTVSVVSSQPEEPVRRSSMDDQWQRTAETQKRKEERRRLRKEKARREAEAAAAAEELARQHREEMRRLEEEELKQERLEKRERKKSKENALDKKAKELKKKEAELLVEAEKLKQAQETMLKANEIKDVARKTKRRDKYTSPTERIQRRDKEVEAMASTTTTTPEADVSTALVVVDEPPPLIPVEMVSTATETEAEAATVEEIATPTVAIQAPATAAPAPAVASPPKSAPVVLPSSEPVVPPVVESAPTSQPGMLPAGFPGTAPPSYAAPMTFAAPFSAVHYSPGFAAMPYAGGVAMPTPYFPHLGYVGGIAPMNPTAQMQAYAMMQPSSNGASTVEEPEAFIGPQLPSPKNSTDDAVQGPAPAPTPAPTSSASSLPDLPDVATF